MPEQNGFIYRPEARVTLTKEEIDQLLECAVHHYDGHCKSWGLAGGKLYGWKNRLAWEEKEGKDLIEVDLTFRDADTLSKISENSLPCREQEIFTLHMFFGKVCRDLNEEFQRHNS